MTVHVSSPTKSYRTGPEKANTGTRSYLGRAPWRPADGYHVYGLDWGEKAIGSTWTEC